MRKEFAVKNATFVYDNSVEVMKKTFEYDGFESQSCDDIYGYENAVVTRSAAIILPTYIFLMIHIIFMLVSLILSFTPIDFIHTDLFLRILIPLSGVLLINTVINAVLAANKVITGSSNFSSYFEDADIRMKEIDNLLAYKEFDNVKTFELVENMWEDSDTIGWILMTTSVNPNETPLFDSLTRNFKFADAENYRPGDNIEINCIDRTISVRK